MYYARTGVGKSALTIQFVLGYFADDCGPNIDGVWAPVTFRNGRPDPNDVSTWKTESYRKLCQIDGGGIILLEVLDPISDQEF